jgi:hypothetical protein
MPDHDLSLTTAHGQLSRKCAACEEEEKPNMLQAKSAGPVAHEAPAIVHQALRSAGQPLDSKTRGFFASGATSATCEFTWTVLPAIPREP